MYFPHFTTKEKVFKKAAENMNILFPDRQTETNYKGYIETEHNLYLFYNINTEYCLEHLTSKDKWWWTSINEIVNLQHILNFSIDRTVYSIFFKRLLLSTLFTKQGLKIEVPYVTYIGGYQDYIAFVAAFGLPKSLPTSNLGPYFYSYTYYGAGRHALWTRSRKSEKKK